MLADAKFPVRYDKMRTAIAECHAVDDCKNIADRSAAMVTYYKQVKDDESVKKFQEIRLRAWRRMGQLMAEVDTSDCETQNGKARKIKEVMGDPATNSLSESRILQLLRLARLPGDGFEAALSKVRGSIDSMLYYGDPVARAEEAERTKQNEERDRRRAAREQAREAREREQEQWRREADAKRRAQEEREERVAKSLRGGGAKSVGITLEPNIKSPQKDIHFMISAEGHQQLRLASFEKQKTMWAIIREALDLWFIANGYPKKFHTDDDDDETETV